MSDFRIIEATINPKRTDNLHDRVRPYIGQRMRLLHAWHIDEEEGPAEYVGQDAWYNPMIGIGWMPTEDLDDIEPFEGTIQQAFISPEQRSNTWREAYSKIARDLLKNQQPGEGAMKIQTLADSTITYGQEIVNGEVKPYRSHHVVSIKYADDGSLASRAETTTRTYVDNELKDGEFEMDVDPFPEKCLP